MGMSEGEIKASGFLNFPGEAGMQKCYCNETTFFFFFSTYAQARGQLCSFPQLFVKMEGK